MRYNIYQNHAHIQKSLIIISRLLDIYDESIMTIIQKIKYLSQLEFSIKIIRLLIIADLYENSARNLPGLLRGQISIAAFPLI
jgi:hypothetical protein